MVSKKLRLFIQISVLLLVTFIGVLHQIIGGGTSGAPSVDSLCAFGGLETLYSFLKDGSLIKKIELSSIVLFGALIISGILFGRAFCGLICPFGTLQELFNKAGKKLKIKRYELPNGIHKYLVCLKYVVLAAILIMTWISGTLIIRPYDPWVAYMHISGGTTALLESPWAFIILALVLIGALFIDRFFCKYLCPLGAFMAVFNKISIFKIKRNPSCISCGKCSKICPMNIDVKSKDIIKDTECIMCTECIPPCPVNNSLVIENSPGKNKKYISAASVIIIITLVFAATVGTTKVLGVFKTSVETEEALKDNKTGDMNPDNIKGYMTLTEISNNFNIPLEKLYSELKLTKSISPDAQLKNIASQLPADSGFSPDAAREVIKKLLTK